MIKFLLILSLPLFCFALAATDHSVSSPDGRNKAVISVENGVTLSISRDGEPLVTPTAISLNFRDRGKWAEPDTGVSPFRLKADTPFYKKRTVAIDGNRLTLALQDGIKLEVCAFGQGIAYRWSVGAGAMSTVPVDSETGGARFPEDVTVLAAYNNGALKDEPMQCSFENTYVYTPLSLTKQKGFMFAPFTLKFASGKVMSIAEAGVIDYPGLSIRRSPTDPLAIEFMFAAESASTDATTRRFCRVKQRHDYLVTNDGPRTFPWRVYMIADSFAGLIDNDLAYALSEPPAEGFDFSWVRPGKSTWDWWSRGQFRGVNFKAGVNTETYRYYIDFASAFGIEYVILDEGWSEKLDVNRIIPEVDMPAILAYAKQKNVGLILWCAWPLLIGTEKEIFKRYADMGVKGFKIDFFDRDDAECSRIMEGFARSAAENKLVVLLHGAHMPAGLDRKWPNVLSYEGVLGIEAAMYGERDFPAHDCNLVIARNLAGPMDYTPGALTNGSRRSLSKNPRRPMSHGTRAHQLALFVVFYSNIQMLADAPTAYEREADFSRFLAEIPVTWDDTVGIDAAPNERAVLARRKGDVWYLGGIVSWNAADFELKTDFLGDGAYKADIYRDGPNAELVGEDYLHDTAEVKRGETIRLHAASGGGFVLKFTPIR